MLDGKHKILFHVGGRVSSPWGNGKWAASGEKDVEMQLCSSTSLLKFDSAETPTSFTVNSPSGGITKHSKVYQLLIDELLRMDNATRAKFLNFVTACPHLPPVGLSMLEIEVLQQHSGGKLPTAQTCGNKLYVPEYDSAESLRSGLAEAFANADYGGLHEHAG